MDVVNEPLHAPPAYKNALGGDGVTGWDWVIKSFELARQYCSDSTKLLINEYNVLHSSSATTNYLNIINLLKDRGLIDGIGIQGHYFEFRSDMNASNQYVYDINAIKSNLNRLAETGLPIYITEFDIDEPIDSNQLAQYKIYFPIFWTHPAVEGITFWGYIQGDVWTSHPNTYLILVSGTERPALQWMRNFVLCPFPPNFLTPSSGNDLPRNPLLSWSSSDSATSYRVQISLSNSFASFLIDSVVTDTFYQSAVLPAGTRHFWRVCGINQFGEGYFSNAVSFVTGNQIVAVNEVGYSPTAFLLEQNYPNPFNPSTKIRWSAPSSGRHTLKVFDVLGNEVLTILDENREAGTYEIDFNAENLPSGIYFYQLVYDHLLQTKKMILIR
ncbi:MAG: endo-1,4-beta-xylanase [Ignavibacteriaceae bacterium]|nr:endo-1,4-beta-xylanase [Ignavibacteriaceae bacterium]